MYLGSFSSYYRNAILTLIVPHVDQRLIVTCRKRLGNKVLKFLSFNLIMIIFILTILKIIFTYLTFHKISYIRHVHEIHKRQSVHRTVWSLLSWILLKCHSVRSVRVKLSCVSKKRCWATTIVKWETIILRTLSPRLPQGFVYNAFWKPDHIPDQMAASNRSELVH